MNGFNQMQAAQGAAQGQASMGMNGFGQSSGLASQFLYDRMIGSRVREPTTKELMRSDVKEWLEDWDK